MPAGGIQIVGDQRLNHRPVALGFAQQCLRGEGGGMQLQRRIARHQRVEARVDQSVLDRQGSARNVQLALGKAPLSGGIQHIERHCVKLELAARKGAGDDFAQHRVKPRDPDCGWISDRSGRHRNVTRGQGARPGHANRAAAQPDRSAAQRAVQYQPSRPCRDAGAACIAFDDCAAAAGTQRQGLTGQGQVGDLERIETNRSAAPQRRQSAAGRPIALNRQGQVLDPPARQRARQSRQPGKADCAARQLHHLQLGQGDQAITGVIFGQTQPRAPAARAVLFEPPRDLG